MFALKSARLGRRALRLARGISRASASRGLALGLVILVGACSRGAEEQECWELLDLYTEKVIDQARPKTDARERAKLKALSREQAKRDPEFRDCPKRVNLAQVECARTAATADDVERCLM
jgi:hypothetical protein